jgi:hypothetical protein
MLITGYVVYPEPSQETCQPCIKHLNIILTGVLFWWGYLDILDIRVGFSLLTNPVMN